MQADQVPIGAEAAFEWAKKHGLVEVSYDHWEADLEARPIYRGSLDHWDLSIKLYPSPGRYRRRRLETARLPNGQEVGRWEWEYRSG